MRRSVKTHPILPWLNSSKLILAKIVLFICHLDRSDFHQALFCHLVELQGDSYDFCIAGALAPRNSNIGAPNFNIGVQVIAKIYQKSRRLPPPNRQSVADEPNDVWIWNACQLRRHFERSGINWRSLEATPLSPQLIRIIFWAVLMCWLEIHRCMFDLADR